MFAIVPTWKSVYTKEKGKGAIERCIYYPLGGLSELLQHEHDHLDGILSIMHSNDNHSFFWKKTS